jgi:hypothetical protein
MDELSQLLVELGDCPGMVHVLEDQILRGKDPAVRSELARKVARLWEEKLRDPREAADAWRRVLRMKPGDPEAQAGLERAKSGMLKRDEQESASPPEPAPELEPAKEPDAIAQAVTDPDPLKEPDSIVEAQPSPEPAPPPELFVAAPAEPSPDPVAGVATDPSPPPVRAESPQAAAAAEVADALEPEGRVAVDDSEIVDDLDLVDDAEPEPAPSAPPPPPPRSIPPPVPHRKK